MQGTAMIKNWLRNKTILGVSLGAALIFFLAGIIFWGGFHTVVEVTNTQEFCTSCHEMQWVQDEYEDRPHWHNASGVGATCSDCHVPEAWGPKMVRKVVASRELWHKALGTINTEEKFEEKRLELAERVWGSMLRTDSRECRNCHEWNHMDLEEQPSRAAREHERAFETGQTCIDCHQGIAHEKPENWDESDIWVERRAEIEERMMAAREEDEPEAAEEPEAAPEPEEVAEEPAPEAETVAQVEHRAPDLDWGNIDSQEITLFLTGQASIEWMQDGSEHGGGRALKFGDRCIWCHDGEEVDIGEMATNAEKIETQDLGDKRGHVPMTVKTAFDDDQLYMRFQWEDSEHAPLPFADGGKMDPDNPIKLAVSFATDEPELVSESGCWASCHHDNRYMPDAPDGQALADSELGELIDLSRGVTKYLAESRTEINVRGRRGAKRGGWDKMVEASKLDELLDQGVYLDLARYKSGAEQTETGYILEQRHLSEGEAVQFSGELEDGVWTVHMTRAMRPDVDTALPLSTGNKYNLGIALHDDHAESRFHHVSWQYGLAFDAEIPGDYAEDMVEFNAQRISQ